ncbi:MAG: hydrogen peroxide-dependent heme synthase [Planctomycetota bacterium]
MNAPHGRPAQYPASLVPEEGMHVGHYLYRFVREGVDGRWTDAAKAQFSGALTQVGEGEERRPARLGSYWTSGHRADFAIMVMDSHPGVVDSIHQSLMSGALAGLIEPEWSFVSMSEVSEYVPSVEEFKQKLIDGGAVEGSPELDAKVSGYERRLPMMNVQRLRPEIPDWPAACFYPMNKSRVVGANWFMESFKNRSDMMSEHARSGIKFAGKVTQLISVGVGLDDWEWMVTLWAKNPEYLREIVYEMRFDEASAKYAEFGPFYTGYKATPEEILDHCRV